MHQEVTSSIWWQKVLNTGDSGLVYITKELLTNIAVLLQLASILWLTSKPILIYDHLLKPNKLFLYL